MRLLLFITVLLNIHTAFAQVCPDSLIKKYHIYKTICTINSNTQSSVHTTLYNNRGQKTSAIGTHKKGNIFTADSTVSFYFYKDTLLVREFWKEYSKKKLIDTSSVVFHYEINTAGQRISLTTTHTDGRITKETYGYHNNLIDTLSYFSNDTMVQSATDRSLVHTYGKALHFTNSITHSRDTNYTILNTVEYKIVPHSMLRDSCAYRITEYYQNGDTTIKKVNYWSHHYGKVTNYTREYSFANKKYEESERGEQSITIFTRNSKGLITEITTIEKRKGERDFRSVSRYQYFYY